jgi:hypothetical protein
MSEVLDTQRLKRAAEDAAHAVAAGDPKVRAGQFDPTPVMKKDPPLKTAKAVR